MIILDKIPKDHLLKKLWHLHLDYPGQEKNIYKTIQALKLKIFNIKINKIFKKYYKLTQTIFPIQKNKDKTM